MALTELKFLVTGVDFAVEDVDIAEVVGLFWVSERLIVLHNEVALLVILVECARVGHVVVVLVNGNTCRPATGMTFLRRYSEPKCCACAATAKQAAARIIDNFFIIVNFERLNDGFLRTYTWP